MRRGTMWRGTMRRPLWTVTGVAGTLCALGALANTEEQRNEPLHVGWRAAAHEARRQARARRSDGNLLHALVGAGQLHGDLAFGVHSVVSPRRKRPRRKSRLLIGAAACFSI